MGRGWRLPLRHRRPFISNLERDAVPHGTALVSHRDSAIAATRGSAVSILFGVFGWRTLIAGIVPETLLSVHELAPGGICRW